MIREHSYVRQYGLSFRLSRHTAQSSAVCVLIRRLIRRLNSSCRLLITFNVWIDFHIRLDRKRAKAGSGMSP